MMIFGSYSNQAEGHDHQVLCKLVELKFKSLKKKRDKLNTSENHVNFSVELFTQTALLIMQFVSNCFFLLLLFKMRKQALSRVVSYF